MNDIALKLADLGADGDKVDKPHALQSRKWTPKPVIAGTILGLIVISVLAIVFLSKTSYTTKFCPTPVTQENGEVIYDYSACDPDESSAIVQ